MNFQWYPGHMTKARRQMEEDIKLIDLVIELLDARAPLSSRNPDIDKLAAGKGRLILLNKTDLADPKATNAWYDYFTGLGINVCKINSHNQADLKQINAVVQKACAAKIERDARRGLKNRPIRAMVAGIPNVGKSTFINSYARRTVAKTGNKPGVTKGKQWIRLGGQLELLDTPGILWPKFEDQAVGLRLALLGSIKDEIMNIEELALEFIKLMEERYPHLLAQKYGIDETGLDTPYTDGRGVTAENLRALRTLEAIAAARGCIKAGAEPDTLKAANLLLENFRNGRLGGISLEEPEK